MTYMSFKTCTLHHPLRIWLVLVNSLRHLVRTWSCYRILCDLTCGTEELKIHLICVFSQHAIQNTIQDRQSFYYCYIRITPELPQNSLLRIFESNHFISNETTLYSIPPPNDEYFDNPFLLQHQTAIAVSNWNNMYCFTATYFTLYAGGYIKQTVE